MTRITKERGAIAKDDRIDALAMAVAYWVEQMDADVNKAQQEHRGLLQDQELEKFMEQVIGAKNEAPSWM